MAKFLFFSDLHCHAHAQYAHALQNGRNSRLQDCLNVIHQAKEIALSRSCDAVIFCGDLFHSRTKLDIDVHSATWSAVRDLSVSVRTALLRGNHDAHNKVGDCHSLEAFQTIATVVAEPSTFEIAGCSFVAEPYTPDSAGLIQRLKAYQPADVLLMHQAIREGSIGPAGISGHGEIGLEDLNLGNWKYVAAGDFHKKQRLGPGGKFFYCGSPLQLTFGEAGEDKSFTLLDTQNWSLEDIPTSAPRFYVFDSPEKYLDAEANGSIRPDIDFIRVLHDDRNRDAAAVVKTRCERIQVVEESAEKEALQRIGNEVASNDCLLLEAYVEQKAGTLDRDRLVAVGLEELWGDAE